ncbi:MAG: 50S ribosomal protein L32 [Limnochordia bacterium]
MANPKRRHSKSRTRLRRATWSAAAATVTNCSRCHEPKLPHRVCSNCGTYAGRQVLEVESDTKAGASG